MNDLKSWADTIKKVGAENRGVTEEQAFNAGRDAGVNGVNEQNCHFRYFGSPALTAAWERGKKAARVSGNAYP